MKFNIDLKYAFQIINKALMIETCFDWFYNESN